MALVVFLRGVNVGGHRTFRPSLLVRPLSEYGLVNIGAAGTFVVRKPGPRAAFVAALRAKLPFETDITVCEGRELIRLETENPFEKEAASSDVVRFVSVLAKPNSARPAIPIALPSADEWLVRVIASEKQFVFGMYRRHMKTIGYLGQLDRLFGGKATTRNWNTILATVRTLKASPA